MKSGTIMPRKYHMRTRLTSVKETQDRIIEAAKELHADQGVQGTSYEEIAEQAGVAQATVYRHFPSLDELIPACARSIVVLQPITPDDIANLFHGRPQPWQRLEWIIRGTCECYARDGGWLNAARREGDLIPALSEVIHTQQESLRTLVGAALEGTGATERSVQVLAALIDFPLWKTFRDVGLTAREATEQILELARDHLVKENLF
jgi:AcrR family transcriptional regulator